MATGGAGKEWDVESEAGMKHGRRLTQLASKGQNRLRFDGSRSQPVAPEVFCSELLQPNQHT